MAGSTYNSDTDTDSGSDSDSNSQSVLASDTYCDDLCDFGDGDGGGAYDCCAMAKSMITEPQNQPITTKSTTASITVIHTRRSTTTIAFVLLLILCCLCDYNYGSWASQCWKKHNSGSISTPDGEFKRPFGILCTYRCFLWFPPIYPYCEFIFDLRLSRHFTSFPDCYDIRCNETFSFFGKEPNFS